LRRKETKKTNTLGNFYYFFLEKVNYQGFGCWLLAVSHWPLAFGFWNWRIGIWLLAIGR
jgi:hypothetical protein